MSWTNHISLLRSPDELIQWMPALKVGFWIALGFFMLAALSRSFARGQVRTVTRANRIFFVVILLLFIGVLAYQASWQIAGFVRPEFVEFMSRYNRRPESPTARMIRGTIYDATGVALALDEPGVPGRRLYPGGPAFAHVIGYDHPVFGLFGVEAAENATLQGLTRASEVEREVFRKNLLRASGLSGSDVRLTLRADLQRELFSLMKDRRGAAVVLDTANGAIVAICSSPSFNPNELSSAMMNRNDPDQRMFNRAWQGLYPPGSTFKVLVAAAALEAGLHPSYDCPGEGMRFGTGNQPIRDHEYYDRKREGRAWRGHGVLGMREALAKSSNIYFARLGVDLGGDELFATAVRFGMTTNWVVHEGSSARIVSSAAQFPALTVDRKAQTAQVSIGQGAMVTTPLHMAMVASAIAGRGRAWAPRLDASAPPRALPPLMAEKTAATLTGMMRYAVEAGTGWAAKLDGVTVAGKTGTAQNPHGDDHGWFIGFAPVDRPALAFAVVIEQGGYGSQSALPVAVGMLKKARALGMLTVPAETRP